MRKIVYILSLFTLATIPANAADNTSQKIKIRYHNPCKQTNLLTFQITNKTRFIDIAHEIAVNENVEGSLHGFCFAKNQTVIFTNMTDNILQYAQDQSSHLSAKSPSLSDNQRKKIFFQQFFFAIKRKKTELIIENQYKIQRKPQI